MHWVCSFCLSAAVSMLLITWQTHSPQALNLVVFKEKMLMLYAFLFTLQSGGLVAQAQVHRSYRTMDTFRVPAVFMVFDCLFCFLPLFSSPLTGCLGV